MSVETPTLECACTAIRKASRAVTRTYDEALASTGLTVSQFAVLRHLARIGCMPLSRLAESLVMDRTSLYRSLTPLIDRGLITISAGRGRAKVAALTSDGAAAMEAARAPWEAKQAELHAALGGERWAVLQTILAEVVVASTSARA